MIGLTANDGATFAASRFLRLRLGVSLRINTDAGCAKNIILLRTRDRSRSHGIVLGHTQARRCDGVILRCLLPGPRSGRSTVRVSIAGRV